MKSVDTDIKDSVRTICILLLVMLFFWWAPDAYTWFSSNVLGRTVVINSRRYEFILFIAFLLGGVGVAAGVANILITLRRRRK